jgi:hypothetical protein
MGDKKNNQLLSMISYLILGLLACINTATDVQEVFVKRSPV